MKMSDNSYDTAFARALKFLAACALFALLFCSALAQDGLGNSFVVANSNPLGEALSMQGYSVSTGGAGKYSGGVFDGNYIWMIPMNSTSVTRLSTSGSMKSYSGWPQGFEPSAKYKFRSGVYDNAGNIWLIPYSAPCVIKLECSTGQMTAYNAWPQGFNSGAAGKFIGGVHYSGRIYMIPAAATGVVCLDTATGAMTQYDNFPNEFYADTLQFSGGVLQGQSLWMIPSSTNMVVKMNLADHSMTGYRAWPEGIGVYDAEKFFGAIPDNSGNLWLVPSSAKRLVKLNTATGAMTGYSNFPGTINSGQDGKFMGGAFDGKNIWLVPQNASALVSVDPATGQMTAFQNFPSGYGSGAALKSAGGVFDGQSLWLIPHNAEQVVRVFTSAGLDLSFNADQKIFSPDGVNIKISGQTPVKAEWFRARTDNAAAITQGNFAEYYSAASAKGAFSSGSMVAHNNGIYWICATYSDGSTVVKRVKIDNIYTPCLTVAGKAGAAQLYSRPVAQPHGLPLEADGALIANPSLGYFEITVAAQAVDGYTAPTPDSRRILLNNILYNTAPNNTVEFNYTKTGQNQGGRPVNAMPAPATPEKTPETPDVKPDKPVATPETPAPVIPPVLPDKTPNLLPVIDAPEAQATGTSHEVAQMPAYIQVPGEYTTPPLEQLDPTGEKQVTYTLFVNLSEEVQQVYALRLIAQPSPELEFLSGALPAFSGAQGVTYTILYKTDLAGAYQTLAAGLPAQEPYAFERPPGVKIAELTLLFDQTPSDFARGNGISYTFKALSDQHSNPYWTTWSTGYELGLNTRALLDRIEQLNLLLAQDPDNPQLTQLLAYARTLINDPYASQAQIDAAVDRIYMNTPERTDTGGQFSDPWIWWPVVIGILALLFILILLIWKRRKKKA